MVCKFSLLVYLFPKSLSNEGCTAAFQVRWVDNCYVVTFINQEHNHSHSSNNRAKKAPENKRRHIDASNGKKSQGNNQSSNHPIVISSIRDQIAQSTILFITA